MSYIKRVLTTRARPIVLINRDLNNTIVARITRRCPSHVRALICLTNCLLHDNRAVLRVARTSSRSLLLTGTIFSRSRLSAAFQSRTLRTINCTSYSTTSVRLIQSLLYPRTITPLTAPVAAATRQFKQLPHLCVAYLRSQMVNPTTRRQVCATLPYSHIVTVGADRGPCLSTPSRLTGRLLTVTPRNDS